MKEFGFQKALKFVPAYDNSFFPISVGNREYRKVLETEQKTKVAIVLERSEDLRSVFSTYIFNNRYKKDNLIYIERMIKTLLWLKGGYKVSIAGPEYIVQYLRGVYCKGGAREFDAVFMGKIYGKEFTIEIIDLNNIPDEKESPKRIGGNLDGCRIGFDAGGSDRKVSAVVNGRTIYSEEVIWHPKLSKDPAYHYAGIIDSLKSAASKMDRVDAIGISAAGIYINNEVKAASLFSKIPESKFDKEVKRMFFDIVEEMGTVPFEIVNDGDVTALAGAMSLGKDGILGIAMGTSEAGGYVDKSGLVTGWLNELAFVPVDYNKKAMMDEWAKDIGCGVKYFSQDGVIKLAENAGVELSKMLSPAEKLKVVQDMINTGDERAVEIFRDIGIYMGYALAYYAEFYDINHVLIMGRVTSGKGGELIVDLANQVLAAEFPELSKLFTVSLPDEKSRRVGQSVAAASLPRLSR